MQKNFLELANFQDNPRQMLAWNVLLQDWCKYFLYGGAAGGGKSYFLRWSLFGLGCYYVEKFNITGFSMGLFSEDYPTLKDRQIGKIKKEMESAAGIGYIREDRDEGYMFQAAEDYGGFKILLRNLDDPSKYASAEFAAIGVEELTKNKREVFDDLRWRMRWPGIKNPKSVNATNPGQVGHSWVKSLWVKPDLRNPDPEQSRFFFCPAHVRDNKYIFENDPDYITQLESLPAEKRAALLDGSWDIFAGQVFSEWRENKHVIDPFEIPPEWKRYCSLDGGYNKPFSLNWYAADYDGHYYKYRELYMNSEQFKSKYGKPLTAETLSDVFLELNGGDAYEYMVADLSLWNKDLTSQRMNGETEGESVAEGMMRKGIKLIKSSKDRYNGLQRYHKMLDDAPDGRPWYQVFRTCYDTIRTIPALVYDEHKVEDVDTDGDDHVYDADRYFFMSRPSPAIEEVKQPTPMQQFRQQLLQQKQEEYGYENY